MLARMLGLGLLVGLVALTVARAVACPFCEATAPTWLQSMREADAAVIAKVTKVAPITSDDVVPSVRVHYMIEDVVQGRDRLPADHNFSFESLESPEVGARHLMTAVGAPDLSWSTLVEFTPTRAAYVAAARELPEAGVPRWQFFCRYLEHADEELAADAYGEFAAASFAEVKAFAKHTDRQQLWRWIESEKTPESRRGLYYTLLGACGDKADGEKLRGMLASPDKRPPGAFSALVACYISLGGEEALCEVEQRFLGAGASESDAQAVIAALRFHGEEQHVLQRERMALSLRLLLERKGLAGTVIPDLARWQDWQCLPRMVKLFKESTGDDAWQRIPVVAYLKVCPQPEAKTALEELKKLDPQAVEQAEALSLFGAQIRPTRTADSDNDSYER